MQGQRFLELRVHASDQHHRPRQLFRRKPSPQYRGPQQTPPLPCRRPQLGRQPAHIHVADDEREQEHARHGEGAGDEEQEVGLEHIERLAAYPGRGDDPHRRQHEDRQEHEEGPLLGEEARPVSEAFVENAARDPRDGVEDRELGREDDEGSAQEERDPKPQPADALDRLALKRHHGGQVAGQLGVPGSERRHDEHARDDDAQQRQEHERDKQFLVDDPHPASETPELGGIVRVEDEPGRADVLIASTDAGDPSLEPRHPEALVAQPERLREEQRAPRPGIRHREDQRGKLIAREQFGRGATEGAGADHQFKQVRRDKADNQKRDEQQGEEPGHQRDLAPFQNVVDDPGHREPEPDEKEHEQRHRLPLDLRAAADHDDLAHELRRLRGPAGPEEAHQRRDEEEPRPEPEPVEPSHAGERRLAGRDRPAFDLPDDDELGHNADPEQPPDGEAVRGDEVGPEQEFATAQAHAERDDGGADDVPEARHARHAPDELEGRPVAALREVGGVRRVRYRALVERLIDAVPVPASLLVARGDRVRHHGPGFGFVQDVGGSKRPSGTVSPAATSSK